MDNEKQTLSIDQTKVTSGLVKPAESVESVVPKKKVNVPAIIMGIIALGLAGAAVFFGIKYFEPKEDPEPIVADQIEKETKIEITTDTIANDYNEVVRMVEDLTANIENTHSYRRNPGDLTYKPDGLNTSVPVRLGVNKTIIKSDEKGVDSATMKARLEKAGFEYYGILPMNGTAPAPDIYGYLNPSTNIICGVSEGETITSPGNSYKFVDLSCAKASWTWLTDDERTMVSKLEAAYYEKEGKYPLLINTDWTGEVKDSGYTPYQTMEISLGGGIGFFYRTSPDADWQFFKSVQGVLDCSDYDTDDLRKAFAGNVCYDGLEQSTVQP